MSARLSDLAAQLQGDLTRALTDTFAVPVWGHPEAMTRALKSVLNSFDAASAPGSEQSIAQSVWTFRKSQTVGSFRDLKYICYGLGLRQGMDESTLLGDESLFPALLDKVKTLTVDPRRFRKCYQGLLSSYLNFPADDSASAQERKHWEHLRDYLRKQLALILRVEPIVSWAKILREHENLLRKKPCERYSAALRKNQWDELEEVAAGLAISSNSWVWKEAVLAHVEAVADIRADDGFRSELDLAVHALNGDRVAFGEEIRRKGAVCLLRRYVRCAHRPEHSALLDLALRCFGKPWLNATTWDAYVGDEDARRLIDSWIKTGLIQDFFQLLAADGIADRSRMLFWPKFVPVIDDIWFAMGKYSRESRDPEYVRLRQRIGRERILNFTGAGHTNNAFIMRIGPYYMVEFGQKGRAAYLVHAGNWKADLRPGASLSLEVRKLQQMGGKQMIHMPADTWGRNFCQEICPRIGWRPGTPVPHHPTLDSVSPTPGGAAPTRTNTGRARVDEEPVQDPILAALNIQLKRFDVSVEDRRSSGGCVWVRKDASNTELNRLLTGRKFKYAEQKGWWRK